MLRGMERWLPGYLASLCRRRAVRGPRHLLFCVADHYEPFECTILASGAVTGGYAAKEARARVRRWCADYAEAMEGLRDADGQPPRHTFFYPWDEYDAGCVDQLQAFCAAGFGEVEVHLHHRHDRPSGLLHKLEQCRDTYAGQHGLLGRDGTGRPRYAFVHGNWALCNARPDGDWCGVERELGLLVKTGCYADLTYPSAPSPTQPRRVNAIYYGGDPAVGRRGVQCLRVVRAGVAAPPASLLCIQGPLGLNWRQRKWGMFPRFENGELSAENPPSTARLALWQRLQVHVTGRPDWIAVKLHTHGMSARSRAGVLGPAVRAFHQAMAAEAGAAGWRLHYVTARELYNMLKAAEAGHAGDPGAFRDFEIAPPPLKG